LTSPAFAPPPELRCADKWAAFKALWREVNAIEPAHPEVMPPEGRQFVAFDGEPRKWQSRWQVKLPGYGNRAYYNVLDEEQTIRLHVSLLRVFDLPVPDDMNIWRVGSSVIPMLAERNNSIETQMLARLLQLRIQQMSRPSYNLGSCEYEVIEEEKFEPCSRAAPWIIGRIADVPPSYYMISAIDRIEARVDALMGLRAKGAISESVFVATLADIWNDARLALFLDAFNGAWEYGRHVPVPRIEKHDFTESLGEDPDLRHVQVWERAIEASMSRLPQSNTKVDEQVEQLKARLVKLWAAFPHLEGLLAELER